MRVFSPWQSLSKLTLLIWLDENVGFHPSFSRHDIAETSFALFIWLGENVQFVAVSFIGTGIKRKPESKALWPDFLTFRFFILCPVVWGHLHLLLGNESEAIESNDLQLAVLMLQP